MPKNWRTGTDGKNYLVRYYNLDMIISVGYRVNYIRGTEFRKWANYVLKQFIFKQPQNLLLRHSEYIIDLQNRVTTLENNQAHQKHLREKEMVEIATVAKNAIVQIKGEADKNNSVLKMHSIGS